jgi:hypothetical protein
MQFLRKKLSWSPHRLEKMGAESFHQYPHTNIAANRFMPSDNIQSLAKRQAVYGIYISWNMFAGVISTCFERASYFLRANVPLLFMLARRREIYKSRWDLQLTALSACAEDHI